MTEPTKGRKGRPDPSVPPDWERLKAVLAEVQALQQAGAWTVPERERLFMEAQTACNGHTEFLEAFGVADSASPPVAQDPSLRVPSSDFPLGEPQGDDVEGAARLLLRYNDAGLLDADRAQMFMMICDDKAGVMKRYREMKVVSDRLSPAAQTREEEVTHFLRCGSRLSAVFGRHTPTAVPTDRAITDWRVYAGALLTRSHYLLESTQALHKREPDAAVLARVLYEHIVAFSWLCIAPEENVRKLIYWELCDRRKAVNDMISVGQDTSSITGIRGLEELLGTDFKAGDPGVPVLAQEADAHWGPRLGAVWERGRGGLRALYPSLYRHFSVFTHPTLAGLHPFILLHGGTARIGRPRPGRAHGVTASPIVFGLGLLVASDALGWPPAAEVMAAFEEDSDPNA